MIEIQRDIGPRNPPSDLGEDPFLIWFRYGLGDLFYSAGKRFGVEILDGIPERLDGMRYAILEALHEARQRLEKENPPVYTPVGIRIDTSQFTPKPTEGTP